MALAPDIPTTLFIVDIPAWFQARLSENLHHELREIKEHLRNLKTLISEVTVLAGALRDAHTKVSTPQATRVIKLCDQIDFLCQVCTAEVPVLPGTSFVTDLVQKMRNRIRTVEDMASSSKLARTDTLVVDKLAVFRSLLHQISETLEVIESRQSKEAITMDYIDYIQNHVFDPMQRLLHQNSLISAHNDTQHIITCANSVKAAEDAYKEACTATIFKKWLALKHDAQQLQEGVEEMLSPLRSAAKHPSVAARISRHDGDMWKRLLPHSSQELLKNCRLRSTMDAFCDGITLFY